MSRTKLIYCCLGLLLAAGCVPKPAIVNPDRIGGHALHDFFRQMPGLVKVFYRNAGLELSDTVEIYMAHFRERYIEKDKLLDLSILGDSSRYPRVEYDDMEGFSQRLFLYHLRTKDKARDLVVYLAAKYDAKGVCIGLGPAYMGTVDLGEGHIDFEFALGVKKVANVITLVSGTDTSKLRRRLQEGKDTRILVFLSDQLRMGVAGRGMTWWGLPEIRVSKIVEYDRNKIGGIQPVVFNIHEIMPDEKGIVFSKYEKMNNE